jgi:transcriptional regulator with XRE-family HTH domain
VYISSNLRLLRNRKGLTQEDLSRLLQIKRSTLNGYENGISRPSLEGLIQLSDFFGVSIDSLIRIDFEKLSEFNFRQLQNGSDPFQRGSNLRILSSTVDSQNIENIEMVPEKAKAGYTTGFADPEFIQDLPRYQLPFLSRNKKFRSFQIVGDSMLPIPEGAWISGEFVQDWTSLKSGSACIILTSNDGIVFKILEMQQDDDTGFIAHSLNPAYQPYPIRMVDIREIWKFNHFISQQIPEKQKGENEILEAIHEIRQELKKLSSKTSSAS